MRLAVMADVHGNRPALEAVLADVAERLGEPDGWIVAGDLAVGPHSDLVVERLRQLRPAWIIRGNGDTALLHYLQGRAPTSRSTALQFALLRWAAANTSQETLAYLDSLPEQCAVPAPRRSAIRVVHGSPRDPAELVFPDRDPELLEAAFDQIDEPVLVCGHTHVPWTVELDGRLALNPGSVACPLNGEVGAQYALLSWQEERARLPGPHLLPVRVEHCTVPYDLRQIRQDFEQSGLWEEGGPLARAFLRSMETGRDVAIDFLTLAHDLARAAGHGQSDAIPDSIWQQAAASMGLDRLDV